MSSKEEAVIQVSETSVGKICLDLVVNQNQFNKQMSGIQSLAKKTGAILAAAFGVKKLVSFGKACVDLGSDLQEVQNVVDVTFPNMTEKVNAFSRSAAASFGLSETMAKKFTGTFGTMAKAFGFTEQQAYDMGSTLAGLAGDVASFYNITQDEAYTKLKSVFSGETETLKDLGVVMTQTALDSYALANGYGKTTKAMSEAEKVALRYAFVQDRLSAASGDFIRTSDGWANQVRVLKLQFDSLKATIGQGLINALTPVLKLFNTLIAKIVSFAQVLSDSLGKIFGWSYQNAGNGVSSDLESGATAASGIASGIDNASKNAKKLKQQLSGIDELNVLSTDSGDSSGGGSSAGVGGTGVDIPSGGEWVKTGGLFSGFDKELKAFEKLFKDIKIGDWFAVGEDVSNIIVAIFDMFANAIDKVNWFGLGQKIGNFIAGIDWTSILSSVGRLIWQAINAAIELWAGMFSTAPIETAILTALALLGAVISMGLPAAIMSGVQAMMGNPAMLSSLTTMFSSLFSNPILLGITAAIAGISTMFVGIYDAIKNGMDWLNAMLIPLGATLAGTGIGAIIGSLGGPIGTGIGALIGLVIGLIVDGIVAIIDVVKNGFNETNSAVLAFLTMPAFLAPIVLLFDEIVGYIKDLFKNKIPAAWDSFVSWLGELPDKISTWFSNLLQPIKDFDWKQFGYDMGKKAGNAIKNICTAVKTFFTETLPEVWASVTTAFEKFFTETLPKFVKEKLPQLFETIKTEFVTFFTETLPEALKDVGQWFLDVGQAIWDGIKEGWDTATQAIGDLVSGFVDGFKDALGIHSPSTVFRDFIGVFLGEGILEGIAEKFSKIEEWINSKIIPPVKKGWELVSAKIKEIFSTLWTGIKKDAIGVMNSLLSTVESAVNKMVGGINKIINGFNKVVSWAAKVAEVNWGKVSTIPTVSLSRIPMLAEGGYVKANTPQLAIIGDNRHHGEIVSPEDKLDKMALKAAQLARGNEDNSYLIQMILLMKQQNELLAGILQKETGITKDDIGQNAREWARDYFKRTGDNAYSF